MPSYERGVYEPPSDDIHVFDEDEDSNQEGSRLPLLIVIALLVLAAFAGVVWLAYSQGVQRGRSDAPRMIVAASGPDKEAAPDSNATDSGASLKIYQQQAPVDEETDTTPQPPTETVKTAPAPAVTAQVSPMDAAPKPTPAAPAAKPTVVPATNQAVATAPPKPLVAEKPKTKPVENAAATAAPVTAAPLPASTPKPASATGSYVLQIGAYKSQADADASWKSFETKHPIVGGYSEDVQKADLGDKGTWYRLRIGSFSDKAAASAFCDKLKADGGNCFLAK